MRNFFVGYGSSHPLFLTPGHLQILQQQSKIYLTFIRKLLIKLTIQLKLKRYRFRSHLIVKNENGCTHACCNIEPPVLPRLCYEQFQLAMVRKWLCCYLLELKEKCFQPQLVWSYLMNFIIGSFGHYFVLVCHLLRSRRRISIYFHPIFLTCK